MPLRCTSVMRVISCRPRCNTFRRQQLKNSNSPPTLLSMRRTIPKKSNAITTSTWASRGNSSRDELPREAHVEVVIAFDFLGIVLLIERSVGGEFEFFNCCRRNVLQRGRHEITRITDVHRSGIVDLPDQIGARTDLLLVVERNIKTVITQAV